MGFFRRGERRLIGLDLGSSAVKAVEYTDYGDRLVISGFSLKAVESKDLVDQAIRDCIAEGNFHTRDVAVSLSGRGVVVRFVNMMKMDESELESAVRYEADKYIPFELSDVVLGCQRLEGVQDATMSDKEMKVLVVAAKRDLVEEVVETAKKIGLSPVIVDVDLFALSNAYEMKQRLGPKMETGDKVDVLVDVGANKTSVAIVKNLTLRFAREFYIAGNDFTDAIARRLGLDLHEAANLKQNPAGREMEIEDAVQQVLADFANEIRLSFDYYESQYEEEVDEIFLSGGGARLYGMSQWLEQAFGKRVTLWDPFELMEVDEASVNPEGVARNAPRLAVAAGLAARVRG